MSSETLFDRDGRLAGPLSHRWPRPKFTNRP